MPTDEDKPSLRDLDQAYARRYSPEVIEPLRARQRLVARINERESFPPHPDSQAEEGQRRAGLSRGADNVSRRVELLIMGEKLGWRKMAYTKPEIKDGIFLKGHSIEGAEQWQSFAQNAHFSVLAKVLHSVRVLYDYQQSDAYQAVAKEATYADQDLLQPQQSRPEVPDRAPDRPQHPRRLSRQPGLGRRDPGRP